jgi:hypothetical protein
MRRTSFCHLTSSYEYPYLAGARRVERLRARPSGIPSASRQNESLRWVSRGPSSGFHRVGRCLPVAMRESRTSDTPVASCTEPVELALLTLSRRPPRPPQFARVNDANRWTIRSAFHRSRTFAPQRPLRRPAPDFARLVAWPPRFPLPTPLNPRESFWDLARAGPPSTSSRCQRGLRFSRPRSSLADFCNRVDVRARPPSCRSSHASGAFAPLLAWHQPMPGCVGLSGALPHRGPASRDPLTPAFTPTGSACADEANHGSRRSSKGLFRAVL